MLIQNIFQIVGTLFYLGAFILIVREIIRKR